MIKIEIELDMGVTLHPSGQLRSDEVLTESPHLAFYLEKTLRQT